MFAVSGVYGRFVSAALLVALTHSFDICVPLQLYIFYCMCDISKIQLLPLGDQGICAAEEMKEFTVEKAECSEESDREKIRSVIEKAPGGKARSPTAWQQMLLVF